MSWVQKLHNKILCQYKPSSFSSYLLNVLLQLANKKWDSKQKKIVAKQKVLLFTVNRFNSFNVDYGYRNILTKIFYRNRNIAIHKRITWLTLNWIKIWISLKWKLKAISAQEIQKRQVFPIYGTALGSATFAYIRGYYTLELVERLSV
jgi:hypothetical protein